MTEPPIPIARPRFGDEEEAAVARVLRSGWIMQGPEVAAFERELAAFVDAPFACAVSSGTAALHLALRAAGVGPGDEVVTASHSFVATANAVVLCGGVPVFVDVERETLNLDPRLVDAAIGPRTRAVLVVHQLGMPADLPALVELCARRGVALVEDAACALGSEVELAGAWQRLGRPHGAAACFSFHPRKLVATGDGGMVTTRDAAIDARVRRLRQHGMDPRGAFVEAAPNYRMTDLQAAVGRVQLGRLTGLLGRRPLALGEDDRARVGAALHGRDERNGRANRAFSSLATTRRRSGSPLHGQLTRARGVDSHPPLRSRARPRGRWRRARSRRRSGPGRAAGRAWIAPRARSRAARPRPGGSPDRRRRAARARS